MALRAHKREPPSRDAAGLLPCPLLSTPEPCTQTPSPRQSTPAGQASQTGERPSTRTSLGHTLRHQTGDSWWAHGLARERVRQLCQGGPTTTKWDTVSPKTPTGGRPEEQGAEETCPVTFLGAGRKTFRRPQGQVHLAPGCEPQSGQDS